MSTRRFRLLTDLVARIQTITTANGYPVELNAVYQQVATLGDDVRDRLPVAAVVERPEQPEVLRRGGDHIEHQQVVFVVQAWAEMDTSATTEPAYALLAALQRCLRHFELSGQLPANAVKVRVSPGYVTVPDQTTWACSCVVEVAIDFRDTIGGPYV